MDSVDTTQSVESPCDGSLLHLSPGKVHVWYVGVDESGTSPATDRENILSIEEEGRRARFVFEKDRRLFLAAHLLVRSVLSKYAPVVPAAWQFKSDDGGKPRIGEPDGIGPLRFNLSHTRGLAAIAVTLEDEVGVDVERITAPADLKLAQTCFATDEIAWLESTPAADQPDRFFEIWTLKEAYLKARGTGLSLPLKDFSVGSYDDRDSSAVTISFRGSIVDDPSMWQFHRCQVTPQHALAVALRRPASQPMQVTLRPWR